MDKETANAPIIELEHDDGDCGSVVSGITEDPFFHMSREFSVSRRNLSINSMNEQNRIQTTGGSQGSSSGHQRRQQQRGGDEPTTTQSKYANMATALQQQQQQQPTEEQQPPPPTQSKYANMAAALQQQQPSSDKQPEETTSSDPQMKTKYSKMFTALQPTTEEESPIHKGKGPILQQPPPPPSTNPNLNEESLSTFCDSLSLNFADRNNKKQSTTTMTHPSSPQQDSASFFDDSVAMNIGGNPYAKKNPKTLKAQMSPEPPSLDDSIAMNIGGKPTKPKPKPTITPQQKPKPKPTTTTTTKQPKTPQKGVVEDESSSPSAWGLSEHPRPIVFEGDDEGDSTRHIRKKHPETWGLSVVPGSRSRKKVNFSSAFKVEEESSEQLERFEDEDEGEEEEEEEGDPSNNNNTGQRQQDKNKDGGSRRKHLIKRVSMNRKESYRAPAKLGNEQAITSAAISPIVAQNLKTIDFLDDEPSEMLYGRQIALYLMKRYRWYNPKLGIKDPFAKAAAKKDGQDSQSVAEKEETFHIRSNDGYLRTHSTLEATSLERAWAHFEHYTLARYIVDDEEERVVKSMKDKSLITRLIHRFQKGDTELARASRGENVLKTKLYHPVFTPHTQLGDWGIGWGLYFASVRAFAVIMFLAGLLNIPNFIYFASEEYSVAQDNLPFLRQGSAICTQTQWVPCPDCLEDSLTAGARNSTTGPWYIEGMRLAKHYDEENGGTLLVFALRNLCNGANRFQGLVNYGSLILVLMGLVLFNRYVQVMEIYFDEDEQTTQDYSIQIENPPPDATDPEEWRKFFNDAFGAHVTCCTVGVNNDTLIQKLVQRREKLRKIERMVEEGTPMDTTSLAGVVSTIERDRTTFQKIVSYVIPGIPELFRSVVVLTQDIRGLAQQEYPATKVFVTFEKENAQRRVLCDMAIGSLHVWRNDYSKLKSRKHLFRGKHMLLVSESDEPDTLRWKYMNEKRRNLIWQVAITSSATLIAVFAAAQVVNWINSNHPWLSALAISGFNVSFPYTAKFITRLEGHRTDTNVQTSMYCKIVFFRWVNTAIVYTLIKPFTSTISADGGLIEEVYNLFFSEIITLNVIQLTDGYGNFLRHVVAPRAKTQDEMNLCFRGLEVELAERYTNMTKIVFLACWYSSIYPGGFFMSSMALAINYFTDRHSLMRTWYRAPQLGPQISEFSRKYFLTTVFVAMALLSSYFWSGFPFDNLCENETEVHANYTGKNITLFPGYGLLKTNSYTLVDNEKVNVTVFVEETDHSYRFCHQDFFRLNISNPFPFISKAQPEGDEWMTPEQELLSDLYGWTFVCVLFFVVICFVQALADSLLTMLYGSGYVVGNDQGIDFSSRKKIAGYIPQVESLVYPYPLIVGKIESASMSYGIIDWTDPTRPHSYYDLTKDAEQILRDIQATKVFSRVKHWLPPPANKIAS